MFQILKFSPPKLEKMSHVHFWKSMHKVHERMTFDKARNQAFSSGSWLTQPSEAKYLPEAGRLVQFRAHSKCTNWKIHWLFYFWQGEERRTCQNSLLYLSSSQKCAHSMSAMKVIHCVTPTLSAQASLTHFSTQKNKGSSLRRDFRGASSISIRPGSILKFRLIVV